jgi:hypothetical protein
VDDAAAQSLRPRLKTNQSFIELLNRPTKLDIARPIDVFEFVLSSVPETATIYPSENYYYFSFFHDSIEYVGNIRLDKSDRDRGMLHFAFFKRYTPWRRGADPTYLYLGKKDGVAVERIDELTYTVTFKDHKKRFDLVDLSKVVPPKSKVGDDEIYIGPTFDESGVQFYLMFNPKYKQFLFVLNEEVPVPEPRYISEHAQNITVGWRTGFAYYNDPFLSRKILVGVHAANSRVNNYYDGPFDQLPDNFIKGNTLRDAILSIEPELEGKMDRLGNSPDGKSRFFIGPYKYYDDETELAEFGECMSDKLVTRANYVLCFSIEEKEEEGEPGSGQK